MTMTMEGKTIFSYIYDKMLYAYCYFWIYVDQKLDQLADFHKNVLWIRKNGAYKGADNVSDSDN